MNRDQQEARKQQRAEVRGESVGTRDGRNVDPGMGLLRGEASAVIVKRPDAAYPLPDARPDAEARTYYGLPSLRTPVWKGWIPTYFWAGGAAGAAATLGAATQIAAPRLRRLIARTRWIAALGTAASAGLLTVDLGRPARFIYMLRVLRVSSPMSVGSWVLTGAGLASGLAALGSERAGLVAGALGLPLSGYTAVLLTNTAVPAWLHARGSMPWLFVASGVASACALLELLPQSPREERVVRTFAVLGKLGELLAMKRVEAALDARPSVGESLRKGRAGLFWRAARWLSAAGLVATFLPSRRRDRRRLAAGLLSTAGAVALRLAIVEAGRQSALEPRATFEPQRARQK